MHQSDTNLDVTVRKLTQRPGDSFARNDTDAYAFLNGPSVQPGENWLDLAKLVARNRQLACKIQKYHHMRDGSFAAVFAHPVTAVIDFYLLQPSPDPYSAFQAQLTGNLVSICEPDALAANDPFLAALNPMFDLTFDYIIERGIGLFQQLSLTHHWAQRHDAMPHLMTSINYDLMRSQVKVIDVTDQLAASPEPELTATGRQPSIPPHASKHSPGSTAASS